LQRIVEKLAHAIREAAQTKSPLRIRGGGTKDFYGGALSGRVLDTAEYAGIVDYEPTELVITARAGTPLEDVEAAMRSRGQMLAFEPPRFAEGGTLGGCIAAGLSGPRRPYAGAARDLVLGIRMLDGKGTDLRFGGQVMKNVAGYDLSRLMAGSLGTLGLLLEVSLKALPLPAAEMTLVREESATRAIEMMNAWAGKPLPVSATCYLDGRLYVRLSGAESALRSAREKIGGEQMREGPILWQQIRDQRLGFFAQPLWRVSLKSTAAPLDLDAPELIEWGGALRWIAGDLPAERVRDAAKRAGGHATLFRGGDRNAGVFQPLTPTLAVLHRRLKATFDPNGILNPGRLYPDF
jgi:glycolate oxidase FAD binding subunit